MVAESFGEAASLTRRSTNKGPGATKEGTVELVVLGAGSQAVVWGWLLAEFWARAIQRVRVSLWLLVATACFLAASSSIGGPQVLPAATGGLGLGVLLYSGWLQLLGRRHNASLTRPGGRANG
jgi:hypothetical protein